MFLLAPDADKQTIGAASRKLTAQLVEALKPFIALQVEKTRQAKPFPEAAEKDGPARFRAPGQPLGIRDSAGFIDEGAGHDIFLAAGAAVWLRLMPTFDPGKPWSSAKLKAAINSGINLPTLIGPANGMYTIRAEDGLGTCIIQTAQEHQTDHVTFAFETGEIWAISTYPLRTHPADLFVGEIEKLLIEQLPRYGRFLQILEIRPPYRWIAGVCGVRGRELQYPLPQNTMRIPGFGSHKCASDNIRKDGSYDMDQSPLSALLPFFEEIYNKCGMSRPPHLAIN